MKQIWKFKLEPSDVATLSMPRGAKCLHAAEQFGEICVWALVDPGEPTEQRRFRTAGTGHQIAEAHCGKYLGTAHLSGGALIFHVFEIEPEAAHAD